MRWWWEDGGMTDVKGVLSLFGPMKTMWPWQWHLGHWLALIGTDWHWLALIGTDWHWLALIGTDWHWLALIGTDWHWLAGTDWNNSPHSDLIHYSWIHPAVSSFYGTYGFCQCLQGWWGNLLLLVTLCYRTMNCPQSTNPSISTVRHFGLLWLIMSCYWCFDQLIQLFSWFCAFYPFFLLPPVFPFPLCVIPLSFQCLCPFFPGFFKKYLLPRLLPCRCFCLQILDFYYPDGPTKPKLRQVTYLSKSPENFFMMDICM